MKYFLQIFFTHCEIIEKCYIYNILIFLITKVYITEDNAFCFYKILFYWLINDKIYNTILFHTFFIDYLLQKKLLCF